MSGAIQSLGAALGAARAVGATNVFMNFMDPTIGATGGGGLKVTSALALISLKTIESPEQFQQQCSYTYEKLDTFSVRPPLQFITEEPSRVRFTLYLHYMLTGNIDATIKQIKSIASKAIPMGLVTGDTSSTALNKVSQVLKQFGNSLTYNGQGFASTRAQLQQAAVNSINKVSPIKPLGYFVIKELGVEYEWATSGGTPIVARLTFDLLEWTGQLPTVLAANGRAVIGANSSLLNSEQVSVLLAQAVSAAVIIKGLPNNIQVGASQITRFAKGLL